MKASALGPTNQTSNSVLGIDITNYGVQPVLHTSPAVVRLHVPERWIPVAWTCDASHQPSAQKGVAPGPDSDGSFRILVWLPAGQTIHCSAERADQNQAVVLVAAVAAPESPADPYLSNNIAVARHPAAALADPNHAPVLTSPGDQANPEGDFVSLPLAATDADDDPLWYGLVAGALPSGARLNPASGLVSGRLADVSAGDYPLSVAVTDGVEVAVQSFTWHVDVRTITLANPGPQQTAVGFPVHLDLQVADRDGLKITIAATGLPAGLVLRSSSDCLRWWIDGQAIAEAVGSHSVTLTASSVGPAISRTFTWDVAADLPPVLTKPANQASVVAIPDSLLLHAQDPGAGTITYGASTLHPLPPGFSFDPSQPGLIKGAATGAGSYVVTVTATARGHVVSQTFSWAVAVNQPPVVSVPVDPVTRVQSSSGNSLGLPMGATDPDPGDSIVSFVVLGLPPGVTYDATTHLLTGHTDTAGLYTVTAKARDLAGNTTTRSFLWIVEDIHEIDLSIAAKATLNPPVIGVTGPQNPSLKVTVVITNRGLESLLHATGHVSLPPDWDGVPWTCQGAHQGSGGILPGPGGHTGSVDLELSGPKGSTLTCVANGPSGPLSSLAVDAVASVAAPGPISDPYLLNNIAVAHYPAQTPATPDHAPVFTNPGDQHIFAGDPISIALQAVDADTDPLAYGVVAGALPPGLELNGSTGVTTGTPPAGSAGDYPVTIAVTDGTDVALQSFVWHVAVPTFSFTGPGTQLSAVDHTIHLPLDIPIFVPGPIAVLASGLPDGLSLQSTPDLRTWWIAGVPTTAAIGPHAVMVNATLGTRTIVRAFTWNIVPDYLPVLDDPGDQLNAVGQSVHLQLHATDQNGDAIVYGIGPRLGLPAGLSLNPTTGLISGMPTVPVLSKTVQVTATANGKKVSRVFQWTIQANHAPTLSNPGDQLSVEQAAVNLQLQAADLDGDALSFGVDPSQPLPPGLTLQPTTGLISGFPGPRGGLLPNLPPKVVFTVGVFVQDQWGVRSPLQTFVWTINRRPVVQDPGEQVTVVGHSVSLPIAVSDPDGDPFIVTVSGLPAGLTSNSSIHGTTIHGTPTGTGHSTVVITATDNRGAVTTLGFEWLVVQAGQTDLVVSATAVGAGDHVTFSVVVENKGQVPIDTHLVVTEPSNVSSGFVHWSCTAGSPGNAAGSMTLTLFNLRHGYSVTCTTALTFTGPSVTLTATASAANDPYPANNTAVVVYPPQP